MEYTNKSFEPDSTNFQKQPHLESSLDASMTMDHSNYHSAIAEVIEDCLRSNKLVRIYVNKGRGVSLSLVGRIVGFDTDMQIIHLYQVDEKQVYSISIFEIEDLITSF